MIVGGEAELLLLLHLFPDGVEELDGAFAVYADEPPIGFDVVRAEDVEDDWAERWREFHHGVQVGRFWVGPPWELPQAVPGSRPGVGGSAAEASSPWELPRAVPGSRPGVGGSAAEASSPWELPRAVPGSRPGVGGSDADVSSPWEAVVIDPGRAFGTGAHPTTRLTLELLQTLEPGSLLDIGCGSGVLSIAAAKLGFAPVHAIDIDDAAVEATAENARRNGVEVEARLLDGLVDELPPVDVALANVALDVVERLLPHVPAAHVVTSGYLERDRPDVPGWDPVGRATADGWAADVFASSQSANRAQPSR